MTITGGNAHNPVILCLDDNGDPVSGAKLYTWLAGTSTPQAIFTDQALTTPHTNPAVANSAGRIIAYLGAFNYKMELRDADDVTIWGPIDGVRDIAQIQFGELGQTLGTGTLAVGTNYTVLATDQIVELTSAGLTMTISPQSGETIDGLSSYTLKAAASPLFPSIVLVPNAAGTAWFIQASHSAT
jgi:hypothetical protein